MFNISKRNPMEPEEVRTLRPPVDIAEKENEVIIEVDLPGVDKESVKVEVNNNILSIQAQKKQDSVAEKNTLLYQERYTNVQYRREFELNTEVDHQKVKASLDGGVLRVALAKSTKAQPKKIEISTSK
jgi:HSP20 family protein